jgi:hypothetical protein
MVKIYRDQLNQIIREVLSQESGLLKEQDEVRIASEVYNERAVAQAIMEKWGKALEKQFPGEAKSSLLRPIGPGYGAPYRQQRLRVDFMLKDNPVQGLGEEGDFFDSPEGWDENLWQDEFDYFVNQENMKFKSQMSRGYDTMVEQYGGSQSFYYIFSLTVYGLHPNENYRI